MTCLDFDSHPRLDYEHNWRGGVGSLMRKGNLNLIMNKNMDFENYEETAYGG